MAGFGKSSRLGKRPFSSSASNSSTAYVSTVTMVMFVAFCLLGVWMLTSTSMVVPSQVVTSRRTRTSSSSSSSAPPLPRFTRLTDPPPAFDDNPGRLPDDAIRDDNNIGDGSNDKIEELSTQKHEEKEGEAKSDDQGNNADMETDGKRDFGQEDQQKDRNSDGSGAEENNLESQSGEGNGNDNRRQQGQVAEGETRQEKQVGINEDNQWQQSQEAGVEDANVEKQQLHDNQKQSGSQEEESGTKSQQVQDDGGSDENRQQSQEQHMDVEGNENQQEAQEQQMDTNGNENQQEAQEQQTDPDNPRQSEDEQIKTSGNENQQQSKQQQIESGGDESQQQLQQPQVEAGSSGNQPQTEIEPGENEQQHQQQADIESGQDVNHWHEQKNEAESGENAGELQQQNSQQYHQQTDDKDGGNEQQTHGQQSEVNSGQNQQQQVEESNENHNEKSQQEDDTITSETSQQQSAEEKLAEPNMSDSLPDGAQSEVSNDGHSGKTQWSTQADQSENEKERREELNEGSGSEDKIKSINGYNWKLCNVTAGPDYIPCLDNEKALRTIHNTGHYEHRERHCPEEGPTCLVPYPKGYRRSIEWPKSRDKIWYHNVPHTKLAEVKGHQNWVKVTGKYLTFPGGGTQFVHGALHYIDFIQQTVHDISWGNHTRVILDVGCGVASFGGYLFERDVLAMSFAPKDEHEAQVQFALERGIPAISAVMGTQRLPFPSRVFDLVHCARCRVPWHADGGALLLELNRVLRPGGYFVWSATPVYQKLKEDVQIWKAMTSLTISMCWDLVKIKKDRLNGVGVAVYRKPVSNECYENRRHHNPPMCKREDDPNAAWYVPLQSCLHRLPVATSERSSKWPQEWPQRLHSPPYWLNNSQMGVYGKPAPADFTADYEHWKGIVKKSYLTGFGINWSKVRNVMDMRAIYGGFAAALKDMPVWVMNVVNVDCPDTLPIIYERGLFGIYHDWCESFSTYPRTYDLLHADHLFSTVTKRCDIVPVMAEIDRIVRPGGQMIVRDDTGIISEVENLLRSLHWEVRLTFSKGHEGILCAEKSDWRPETYSGSS